MLGDEAAGIGLVADDRVAAAAQRRFHEIGEQCGAAGAVAVAEDDIGLGAARRGSTLREGIEWQSIRTAWPKRLVRAAHQLAQRRGDRACRATRSGAAPRRRGRRRR